MLIIHRTIIPHCYDADYIVYTFSKQNIDVYTYIHKEDLDTFLCNCLKAAYFRLITKNNCSIKVVTNSYTDWTDKGSIGDIRIPIEILERHSQFSLKMCQKGYECSLYRTGTKNSLRNTVQHRCVLCRNPGQTSDELLQKYPEVMNHNIRLIKEDCLDKHDFDISGIQPIFDTRELPKLLRDEQIRGYVLKLLAGENLCHAKVIPLSF